MQRGWFLCPIWLNLRWRRWCVCAWVLRMQLRVGEDDRFGWLQPCSTSHVWNCFILFADIPLAILLLICSAGSRVFNIATSRTIHLRCPKCILLWVQFWSEYLITSEATRLPFIHTEWNAIFFFFLLDASNFTFNSLHFYIVFSALHISSLV